MSDLEKLSCALDGPYSPYNTPVHAKIKTCSHNQTTSTTIKYHFIFLSIHLAKTTQIWLKILENFDNVLAKLAKENLCLARA